MTPRSLRLVAAAVLAAAAVPLAALTAGPASAAVCQDEGGVSVVVDFRELGGGVQSVCDTNGAGKTAATLMTDNGFPLTYVQRQPGFVCRVSGKPESDPCVNTPPSSAYWGLYWSNGTSGSWTYASQGASSLTVPAGGSVGFAWQGASTGPPGVSPPASGGGSPSPTPTSSPSPSPSSPSPTSGAASTSPTKTPSQTPTKSPTKAPTSGSTSGGGAHPTGSSTTGPGATRPSTTDSAAAAGSSTSGAPDEPSADGSESATPDDDGTTLDPTSEDASSAAASGGSTNSASPDASTEADPPTGSGSVPIPIVLAVMALLGAAVAGVVVVRGRRT